MRRYGYEPPWTDPRFGLVWKRGEELWDGSGFEWTLQAEVFRSPFLELMFKHFVGGLKGDWLGDELYPIKLVRENYTTNQKG